MPSQVFLAITVPLGVLASRGLFEADVVFAAALLAVFLVRTFYFTFFELSWQGQTPGKRRLRLRAVDARGGPLTAEAIIARNLTREVELFLPLVALFAPEALFGGAPGWARLAALAWMLAFGLLPLFNRDRLRVGDLIAGTVVVRTPDAVLLEDLSSARAREELGFTDAQIDVYGVYELQVLEDVLRGRGLAGHDEAVRTVAGKIREKIGWTGPAIADEPFPGLPDVTGAKPDLVVSCGDLPWDDLERIVDVANVPLVYVPGNHDPALVSRSSHVAIG
jgi:uncharacterized RDD family membrane protein YckC